MFISTVSGNLVDKPEKMKSGVRFKIAQNQKSKDGEHVHYVSCVNFQTGLEDILLNLEKGEPVTVNGRTTIAQNEANGTTYLNINLVADNVTLPPKKAAGAAVEETKTNTGTPFPFAAK